ncbi:MAG: L-histidine N(alpha)-methyltransferase [Candidatus Thiodiazotropha sp. (ex Myrtea spinifera)]|nr:L-histidine N(alpha)-methyltransferase [Candidatus Thiodiazotropha sp. (ex Myrtea spinifera)]MCU7827869.1 L-histidine N(alpha)-methyltransferase [Candidatus Thiodiazotropha sp. (ex Myrtea sp. 'scaly one' KF741663)]
MTARITFHDLKPEGLSLHEAVISGLSRTQKSIPPKFFYDERGSELFDAICRQPEYYLPDVERAMLLQVAEEIEAHTGRQRILIEPGAGNAAKVRLLLEALEPSAYVPMDISCDYLKGAAHDLVMDFPWLPVHAVCVDYTHSLPLPSTLPEGRRLAFFPGSSLGNFEPVEALLFLKMVQKALGEEGMLLIGVDTKKPSEILDAAYNDAAGVTAEFNLNLLYRIRRELDADLDPDTFAHQAYYNQDAGRIEMHLVSRQLQRVRVNGQSFQFREGETLHTESSYKYAPDEFLSLAGQAGFKARCHWLDRQRLFAIYLFDVAKN